MIIMVLSEEAETPILSAEHLFFLAEMKSKVGMDDNNGIGDGDVGDGDGPNGNVRTNRSREKIWWKSVKRIQSHTATDCVFVGVPQTEESSFPTFCKTFLENSEIKTGQACIMGTIFI